MSKTPIEAKKVITPKFKVSYPAVFEPKSFQNQAAKYSLTMLFDKKTTDMKPLLAALHAAAVEKFGPEKAKWPKFKNPSINDGDEMTEKPECAGHWVVRASAKAENKPQVVDQLRNPIGPTDGAFYAGCFARASLIAFGYDQAGNRGVSFALGNIQKMGDGKALSGRKNAKDEFGEIEVEEGSSEEDSGLGEFI